MSLHSIIQKSEKIVSDNAPLILTGVGTAGVLTTAYLTGKATIKATKLVDIENSNRKNKAEMGRYPERDLTNLEIAKLVWTLYLPAGGAALTTIAAIILANRIGTRRTAALAAAYAVSDKAMGEYKEKVVEKLGVKKEREVRDELAQEKLRGVAVNDLLVPDGKVLMLDTYTMKPFVSTVEKVRKAENDLRELLLNGEKTITVSDWLSVIGLRKTPYSDDFGWNRESGFKLDFTAGMTDENQPCLVWHFVIDPQYRPEPTKSDPFQI